MAKSGFSDAETAAERTPERRQAAQVFLAAVSDGRQSAAQKIVERLVPTEDRRVFPHGAISARLR